MADMIMPFREAAEIADFTQRCTPQMWNQAVDILSKDFHNQLGPRDQWQDATAMTMVRLHQVHVNWQYKILQTRMHIIACLRVPALPCKALSICSWKHHDLAVGLVMIMSIAAMDSSIYLA